MPPPDFVVDELEVGGSEWIASLMPDAHVIKAFDNLYSPKLADDPVTESGRRILFYAGDDHDSKERFRSAVGDFGFAPVDLGPLRMGRLMQIDAFTSTGVRAERSGYVLDGDFTMKGIRKPISLGLEFNGISPGMGHGAVAGFQALVMLNRKDFGIDINMPLETGGVVLGDKVTVMLEIEALKSA